MNQLSATMTRLGGVNLLPLIIALIALALIGAPSIWITLTVAGLAMGMMLFLMASGLSLVFGLMDVLNFGHSAFASLGAFVAATVLAHLGGWLGADDWMLNIAALLIAIAAAVVAGLLGGFLFERIIIRPVYRDHLRQILITMGALIVSEQLIVVIWGGSPLPVVRPRILQGAFVWGNVSIESYRIFAVVLGVAVYLGLYLLLNRTRVGLLIRAGVENREMVEALGFRIGALFIGVFMLGSALAAMGGAMWAGYQQLISPTMGAQMMIVVFIVVIIGGLGSIEGTLLGALLVGLMDNYVGFLLPKAALASNMVLMMVILMWRPSGLRPAAK